MAYNPLLILKLKLSDPTLLTKGTRSNFFGDNILGPPNSDKLK